jgi:hypothetical protein
MADTPFPICSYHAVKLYQHMKQVIQETVFGPEAFTETPEKVLKRESDAARRKAMFEAQSLVYYVRIHDYIKIGTTTNLKSRLSSLRVDRDALLATEPGGRKLEAQRHKQFSSIRIGTRENFQPVPALMAHIKAIREFHGEPRLTTWVHHLKEQQTA